MRRFFGAVKDGQFVVEGEELKHLTNVIRLKVGDSFVGVCDDEFDYLCQIVTLDKKCARAKILEKRKNTANPQKEIVLFQALVKKEAFETIVQKACELGASRLVPFESEFCVNKGSINLPRYNAIILSACKQCERSKVMQIEKPLSFDQMIETLPQFDAVIFANENEEKRDFSSFLSVFGQKINKIALIIGCEGGFSQSEIAKILQVQNVYSLSLGSRILRADSAAILLMGLSSLLSGN